MMVVSLPVNSFFDGRKENYGDDGFYDNPNGTNGSRYMISVIEVNSRYDDEEGE